MAEKLSVLQLANTVEMEHRCILAVQAFAEKQGVIMSVLIKGMAMPNNCLMCPLYNGHGCKATLQMFHPITNVGVRVDSCPLIEVKEPHGRLIDADDAYEQIRQRLGIRNLDYLLEAEKPIAISIKESPTVIEAEE